jgi:DNA-binding NarL/FixJ family response regulator
MKKIRILVIEDNRVLRDGLITLLNGQSDMRVVAAIGSGNKVLKTVSKLKPHIELLDLGLLSDKHRRVLEAVKNHFPEVKVIGMGLLPTQADIIESVEAGVSGFILKDATVKELIETIRSVVKGMKVLPPLMTDSLFSCVIENALKKGKGKLTSAVRMTKRERQVVELIADGLTNMDIAQKLHLSTYTVKSHVHNILEKLTLHNRLQISRYAHDTETFSTAANTISLIEA